MAHRGASYHAPENTAAAFKKAYDFNVDGIETDLQLTRMERLLFITTIILMTPQMAEVQSSQRPWRSSSSMTLAKGRRY